MEKRFVFACAIAAAAMAGCAAPTPDTTAMGAGPGCDLRLDVGADHRCAVTHVTPPDPQSELARQVYEFGQQTTPRP